ncbi:BLUF domain-containing protein [Cereibacter sphaeroides]|uniref:BLUF domain-containing protein n=1 Tax=Cereibacter sphaeroides TaxID=1063 RepID=UPI001F3658EF|nr:BLUF domain-containing protein [Cereibacter sphaeroides]MCE6957629.1 BLUF domain-containing protein [Cereibacter sphaeroides]MCE6971287.1 BLUF domain-containing protein [Cereibacter sphaeroides]
MTSTHALMNPRPKPVVSGDLVSLTYRSRVRLDDPEREILSIIRASRVTNPRLGITGVLFYSGFHFVQTVEGQRSACNTLFTRISNDHRHREIQALALIEIETRRFPDWAMQLVSRQELRARLPELKQIDALDPEEAERVHASTVARLGMARS